MQRAGRDGAELQGPREDAGNNQQPAADNSPPPGSLGGGPSDLWRGVGQENTGILEGAKQEIDELTHRIETLEAELAQSHVDKDALTAQLRTESEKRQQFEEFFLIVLGLFKNLKNRFFVG